jgi:hypothetical protein
MRLLKAGINLTVSSIFNPQPHTGSGILAFTEFTIPTNDPGRKAHQNIVGSSQRTMQNLHRNTSPLFPWGPQNGSDWSC